MEKALIRAVRQNQGVGSVEGVHNNVTYCWDTKPHDYRGGTRPTFRSGKPNAKEFRLYLSSSTHNTRKTALGTSCGMTGGRLTSVGSGDDMLFFHCDHGSSNGYKYGIITNLPLRRIKTEEKPVCLPHGFPDEPGAVIP